MYFIRIWISCVLICTAIWSVSARTEADVSHDWHIPLIGKWSIRTDFVELEENGNPDDSPIRVPDSAVVSFSSRLLARISAEDGSTLWRYEYSSTVTSTVHALDATSLWTIFWVDDVVVVLNSTSGELVCSWSQVTDGELTLRDVRVLNSTHVVVAAGNEISVRRAITGDSCTSVDIFMINEKDNLVSLWRLNSDILAMTEHLNLYMVPARSHVSLPDDLCSSCIVVDRLNSSSYLTSKYESSLVCQCGHEVRICGDTVKDGFLSCSAVSQVDFVTAKGRESISDVEFSGGVASVSSHLFSVGVGTDVHLGSNKKVCRLGSVVGSQLSVKMICEEENASEKLSHCGPWTMASVPHEEKDDNRCVEGHKIGWDANLQICFPNLARTAVKSVHCAWKNELAIVSCRGGETESCDNIEMREEIRVWVELVDGQILSASNLNQSDYWTREEELADGATRVLYVDRADDEFGFSKQIWLASALGRVVCLDSSSGEVEWSLFLHERRPMALVVLSHAATVSFAETVVAVVSAESTNRRWVTDAIHVDKNGQNPRVGDSMWIRGVPLHQVVVSPLLRADGGHTLIAVDAKSMLHIFPAPTDADWAIWKPFREESIVHTFILDRALALISGFEVSVFYADAISLWNRTLVASGGSLVDFSVHSASVFDSTGSHPVRFHAPILTKTPDASGVVAPRYILRSLIAYITRVESGDAILVQLSLMESISGRILARFALTGADPAMPVSLELSDHFVAVTGWNLEQGRPQLWWIDMTKSPFWTDVESSRGAQVDFAVTIQPPECSFASFYLPWSADVVSSTTSLHGIARSQLLMGSWNGIAVIDRKLLEIAGELSKPSTVLPDGAPVPGAILGLPAPRILKPLDRLGFIRSPEGILSEPTRLESTVLVFAHGLDLYQARVTPFKSFDRLPDVPMLGLMLGVSIAGLAIVSYVTTRVVRRTTLNRVWK